MVRVWGTSSGPRHSCSACSHTGREGRTTCLPCRRQDGEGGVLHDDGGVVVGRCQRFSGEWEMSARKARKWLGRQQTGRVDELVAKADKLVVG